MAKYASVCLLDVPASLDRPFDYRVPEGMRGRVMRGSVVFVPFSRANRRYMAVVLSVGDRTESENTKDLIGIHSEITLSDEQMALCAFLKEYTLCSTGDALRALLPPAAALRPASRPQMAVYARRTGTEICLRGEKQRALYEALDTEFALTDVLFAKTGASMAQLRALEKLGAVELRTEPRWRNPYGGVLPGGGENILSPHQTAAYEKLCRLYEEEGARCALLFGVTGSGKTRVMKALIDRVLRDRKSVIVLVPEISLTPQTVGLFCSFYGARVAVLHSSLSAGERYDAYRRIAAGEVDLVIGTRSAVFAPLANLGAIIIDEEQEHTYKSDMSPKYHARDVAAFRLGRCGGLLLLASATPSVESYYKAKTGVYTLVELTERYGGAHLPAVYIADMRREALGGNLSPFGGLLREKLTETLSGGDQAILFLNRRGYNAFLSCRDCGEAVLCPRCSVSLTRHRTQGGDYLLCHYCGRREKIPDVCPSCRGTHLAFMGYGTQKAEEAFHEIFSGTLLRMDADTTVKKNAYDQMLRRFRAHGADVLLGTQMVAKGHDFPDVTLVGVLNADAALYLDDFRAGERTFSMLTQVIGRAGRAKKRGAAVIQTMNPNHEVIRLAAAQDYKAFYERDIRLRESFTFPPFCDIAVISVSSRTEAAVSSAATALFEELRRLMNGAFRDVPVISFGPFEAPVYKMDATYRMRVVLKCRRSKQLLRMLGALLETFSAPAYKAVSVGVDVNPTNL